MTRVLETSAKYKTENEKLDKELKSINIKLNAAEKKLIELENAWSGEIRGRKKDKNEWVDKVRMYEGFY